LHRCAGGLWLQGHTARASLLCSVGKIYHCVHYLSAAPRITRSESVFVALGIQHILRVLHIVICGLPRSTKFFHIILLPARFSGGWGGGWGKDFIEHKIQNVCFDCLYKFFEIFLGSFAKLRKATISFVTCVRPSVCPFFRMERIDSH